MARAIDQFLAAIRQAIYGRDVREAIASGIEQCYEDSTANAQKADIEAKGAEVLASIPDTYEDLQNDVDDVTYYPNLFYVTNPVDGNYNGVNVTFNSDGTITLNGTSTSTFGFGLMGGKWGIDGDFRKNLFAGEIISNKRTLLSGTESGPPTIRYTYSDASEGVSIKQNESVTLQQDACLIFYVANNRTFSNAVYEIIVQKSDSIKKSAIDLDGRNDLELLNSLLRDTNNKLPLHDYSGTYAGIAVEIKNGVLKLQGTSTKTFRLKLSGWYEFSDTTKEAWKSEELSQFEAGKTYSLHNIFISGRLPENTGISVRNATGSVISVTYPEATIESTPSYAMLYVPVGSVLNVSYIPMFIEGTLKNQAYYKQILDLISIDGVKKYEKPNTESYIYDSTLEYAIKFPLYAQKSTLKPVPLVILAHGLSGVVTDSTWSFEDVANKFVADGYAVMDVNQVTTQDWCNPALIKKYITAIKDVCDKYYVEPCVIYGCSMGSLIGLCLATLVSGIKACVISGIRLDFKARYESNSTTPEHKAIIDANLGFNSSSGYDAYIASGWDKLAYNITNGESEKICPIQFPPTRFMYSPSDTLTLTESLEKIEEIKRGGTICDVKEYLGANHTQMCHLTAESSATDALNWANTWC